MNLTLHIVSGNLDPQWLPGLPWQPSLSSREGPLTQMLIGTQLSAFSETYHHPLPPPLAFCQPLLILVAHYPVAFPSPTPEFLIDSVLLSHLLQHQLYFLILSSHLLFLLTPSPNPDYSSIGQCPFTHQKSLLGIQSPLGNLLGRSHFVMLQAGFPLWSLIGGTQSH